jgi:phytoene dehydrogenase-like protein
VTAARELTMRGRSAVLVEARDRLGGRTYTLDHDGLAMELGGTWVHPLQPRVWAEIDRYGIELETFPVVEGLRQAVVSGGRVVDLFDDDVALGGRRGRRGRRGRLTRPVHPGRAEVITLAEFHHAAANALGREQSDEICCRYQRQQRESSTSERGPVVIASILS